VSKSPRITDTKKLSIVTDQGNITGNQTVCVNPLRSNKNGNNKNYLKNALEILEKAEENNIVEKPKGNKGFWSFLDGFRCGRCDQN